MKYTVSTKIVTIKLEMWYQQYCKNKTKKQTLGKLILTADLMLSFSHFDSEEQKNALTKKISCYALLLPNFIYYT